MKFRMVTTCTVAVALCCAAAFGQAVGTGVGDGESDATVPAPPPMAGTDTHTNPFVDETVPVEPVDDYPETCAPCGAKCGGCGGGGGCGSILCQPGDPASVWDMLTGGCSDIKVGCWVQAGYYNYNNGMFSDYPHAVNVNQMWAFIEKEVDSSCGFDWGFRCDYVYGTDGPDTQAFGSPPNGWDLDWNAGNFYGHAIPQLYVDVAYCDLSVRFGHFYTVAGYEVVPAPDNFFYSHAFTMYWAEPFTHSGALATYTLGDHVTIYGGWTAGFDTGFNTFGGDNFLGGISASLTDNITVTYTSTFGKFGFGTSSSGYSHSIVVDVDLSKRLNYVFQSDFIDYRGFVLEPPFGRNVVHRYGVNQYLFYEINKCLAAGLRLEWFNAEDDIGTDGRSDLYELTFGINYKPCPNFRIRPEVRWDKDDDAFTVAPARNETVGFGLDMILLF
jgi:hypothetical protein